MGLRTIDLCEHDPRWSALYEAERAELAELLGPAAMQIEHIGSTAVPGLVAKPTIDIAVVVASMADLEPNVEAIEDLGYHWRPSFDEGHRFARKVADASEHTTCTSCSPAGPSSTTGSSSVISLRTDAGAREACGAVKRDRKALPRGPRQLRRREDRRGRAAAGRRPGSSRSASDRGDQLVGHPLRHALRVGGR